MGNWPTPRPAVVNCTKCGVEFTRDTTSNRSGRRCVACAKAQAADWHQKRKALRGGWHKGVKWSTSPRAIAQLFSRYVLLAETFEAAVVKGKYGACWSWTRKKNSTGYGYMHFRGALVLAHRVSWMLSTGEWPDEALLVCHGCDNPECTNPDHLFLGTAKDNAQDAVRKGRIKHGCSQGHSMTATEGVVIVNGKRRCAACLENKQRAAA